MTEFICVLSPARRFRDLKAVPDDRELQDQQQIEQPVRLLTAAEPNAQQVKGPPQSGG